MHGCEMLLKARILVFQLEWRVVRARLGNNSVKTPSLRSTASLEAKYHNNKSNFSSKVRVWSVRYSYMAKLKRKIIRISMLLRLINRVYNSKKADAKNPLVRNSKSASEFRLSTNSKSLRPDRTQSYATKILNKSSS